MKSILYWLKVNLVGIVGCLFLRILLPTVRIIFHCDSGSEEILSKGVPVIYAFWHGRMLIPAWTHRGKGIHILVSQHRDGEYINQVIRRLGYAPIRGSSTRGGAKALKTMAETAQGNRDLAITPDGPLGPKYRVQTGVLFLAQKTGRPIIPGGIAIDRYWQMPSWDEFRVPKPFARASIFIGQPVSVPAKISKEELETQRAQLENELTQLTLQAEEEVLRRKDYGQGQKGA